MANLKPNFLTWVPEILAVPENLSLSRVRDALQLPLLSIVDYPPSRPRGPQNAYQSDADYWWPDTDPESPFVRKDGMSYPGVFSAHRRVLRQLRSRLALLAFASTEMSHPEIHAHIERLLDTFFVDPATRMEPHLRYAQGIQGRRVGRAPGLIDGLPFAEIAIAIRYWLQAYDSPVAIPVKAWFRTYLDFLWHSEFGRSERARENNHAPACWLQISSIALLVNDSFYLKAARSWLENDFYPHQMEVEGYFPAELARTKPLGYSIFIVNCISLIHQCLALDGYDATWQFALEDGRGFRSALTWVLPFIAGPEMWPFAPDVQYFKAWRLQHPALFFGNFSLDELPPVQAIDLLGTQLTPEEVDRNMPATCFPIWNKQPQT